MAIKLSNRSKLIKPSPTLSLSAKANQMKDAGIDVISFGVGEPDFNTPDYIKQSAHKALDANFTRYTANAGIPDLKKAICAKLLRDNGLEYAPKDILVSPGAKASILNVLTAVCDTDDQVLIPSPYWVSYPYQVLLADSVPVYIPTREEDSYKLQAKDLEDAILESPCAKVLMLNSPNNPTGTVYTREELSAIADLCVKHNILVISDEIYERLVYDDTRHISIASLNPEIKEHTVVVNGVSKAYAMTGWRLGYAAGPTHIIAAAGRVQEHSTSCVNSITQKACVSALNDEDDSIEKMRMEFWKRRDRLFDLLQAIPHISCFKPQGAFYIMPNIEWYLKHNNAGLKNSDEFCDKLLEKHHVALVAGSSFGLKGTVRFSYANSLANIEEGVRRFANFLRELSQ
ncbi:MAG: pyridoxal phosphate-dependent aminotransferase [Candidatus Cloacimonetes bacterium]|jgi:aspartate aminotransferase|nr:pyridoxal phosphate-dependent aminotransferase [Candidatus Cloacimonadota bacterium]MDY0337180.1 pyridoxal phosphate-dependent aminotransferase [Candidatus Cloacimonadaceae bacterium]MCB5270145.1 pyridoxal phosphate-dependent aminotransferase [Candidatus Cloacimonadota bacterium]MCK9333700.1 pyridoxal phosphate-dependent aminotransferase [Candidatus Cloacimonadota bacterium]MDD2543568.1 pyridoxal phosphate-dependent aminotransferase [Candidatus Cloacimonadota bacterium]